MTVLEISVLEHQSFAGSRVVKNHASINCVLDMTIRDQRTSGMDMDIVLSYRF